MKAGRNDPCPCGSGKKFKKCCLGTAEPTPPVSHEDRPTKTKATVAPKRPPAWSRPAPQEIPARPPLSPIQLKWEAIWKEFESQHGEAREAIFLRIFDDSDFRDDETAFAMLNELHADAVARGQRGRFGHMVATLAERWPEVYQASAHHYLYWQLEDALAEGRPDVLPLTRALANHAGRHLDLVQQGLAALAYHGQLNSLVEAMRIGWPLVRESEDVMGWAIDEFCETGVRYEMYAYLETAPSPDPSNGELLERIRHFVKDWDQEYVADFIADVSGNANRDWTLADFEVTPPRTGRRQDKRATDEEETPSQVSRNLYRLITQFVGYLRRVEQVPYSRGELIRTALHAYFIERDKGNLDPQASLLERTLHPNKKSPRPPKPSHPLCPEPITFDVCIAQMFGFMSAHHHKAAALFGIIPAWLRFLLSKNLIDDAQRSRTLEELCPLHANILKLMESYTDDPTLYRSLKGWPGVP